VIGAERDEVPVVELVALVAYSLEKLAARISRDLDTDAGEGVPPEDLAWAETIAGVAGYARECVAVLDDPRIAAVLTARPAAPGESRSGASPC
jgi:hypothetical protein